MSFERLVSLFVQLPGWLIYLLLGLLAFVTAMLIQALGGYWILRRLRRENPGHWAERARLAFPYASFSMLHLAMVSTGWLAAGIPVWRNVWAPLPMAAAACLGILTLSRPTWRRLRRAPDREIDEGKRRALGWIHLSLLNAMCFVLPLLVVLSLPQRSTPQVWLTIVAMSVAVIAFRAWLSVPLARVTGVLGPAPEALQTRVAGIAAERGIAVPTAYAIRSETANAFAITTCHSVGLTDAALEILSPPEQDSIIRHEIAHLTESRALRWLRLLNFLVYFPLLALPPLLGQFGSGGLWIGLLGFFLLSRLWGNFSRAMERHADQQAKHPGQRRPEPLGESAAGSGADLTYACALEKLYRYNLVPAVLRGRGLSHPNLYDRLIAAGMKPDFPRPQPPPRAARALALALVLVGVVATAFLLHSLGPIWA